MAKRYNLHYDIVKKWKLREGIMDETTRLSRLNTTLTKEGEDLILFEKKQKKLYLGDIYCVLKDKI